jgi:SAM-dependent methyltransferase
MHRSVLDFIRVEVASRNLSDRSVLEVGSLNVNGSARSYFSGEYWGVDMRPGSGVDEVLNAHDLRDADGPFDVIVCTEMLEHDDAPWISLRQMAGACAPGGHLLVTARGYDHRGCFPVHGYPHDLWRFSCAGLEALLHHTGWQPELIKADPEVPGVFAIAVKCD